MQTQLPPAPLTDEQVWLQMWLAVAASSNCNTGDVPARWADRGLERFRERFPKPRV
mgnify:CR=1 FL=1